jgi:hypothetical protein
VQRFRARKKLVEEGPMKILFSIQIYQTPGRGFV